MQCPQCTGVRLVMADRQGIEVDYWPECRGVWLDRGEFDNLIERSAASRGPEPRPPAPDERSCMAHGRSGGACWVSSSTSTSGTMRSLLRRWLPPEQELRRRPMLRWLGPLLGKPWLWSTSRRGVSLGLAIGLFFGFLLPLGQALAAGVIAVWARANLPIAVAVTLVSNPLTTPGILAGAYYIGATALGVAPGAPAEAGLTLLERVHTVGGPLAAGLAILATVVSAAGFVLVQVAWRVASYARLMRRRRATVRA